MPGFPPAAHMGIEKQMAERTDVYLITGFLGSGKTTFLKRVLQWVPKDRKLVVLMNEFGEIGVDGSLVHGEGFDLLEISRGSIFCSCVKTDFIRALHETATRIRPDLLIVESTGAADPSGLRRDLNLPLFKGRFRLVQQFCIIDPTHFEEAYHVFASVEKQIASSTLFVINKKDLASSEEIEQSKELVRRHHPQPRFLETTFGHIPMGLFFGPPEESSEGEESPAAPSLSMGLEETIDRVLNLQSVDLLPPDRLLSAVYVWGGNGCDAFRRMMERLPAGLVRGKGFIGDGDGVFLFDFVMGKGELKPAHLPKERSALVNRLVFIGPPDAMMRLEEFGRENHLLSKEAPSQPS